MLPRYHLINEINDQGDVYVKCIEMIDVANPLTKALAQQKHDGHTSSMGIRYMSDWLQCKWEIVSVCALETTLLCFSLRHLDY